LYGPEKQRIVTSSAGALITVNEKELVNFVSFNLLGLADDPRIKKVGRETIEKYCVGTCGPRGFYGTLDLHLELEEKFAKFMGVQQSILYSFGYATISSVIPAFLKQGDLIVVDEYLCSAGWSGVDLSKSQVIPFKHNDMADLERVLENLARADATKPPKKLNRRFIIVESVYLNTGAVLDLPRLIELKDKHRFRVIMDESLSIGVMGKTGRGITEHYGVPVKSIEMITASLSFGFGSMGGLCFGSDLAVDHQRLAASGYCFSASLPGFLASSATASLGIILEDPALPAKLRSIAKETHQRLASASLGPLTVAYGADPKAPAAESPVIHLRLKNAAPVPEANKILQRIADACEQEGVAVEVSRYVCDDLHAAPPSIRVVVAAHHTQKHLDALVSALTKATKGI
jgi:serine palmitoyltransferase